MTQPTAPEIVRRNHGKGHSYTLDGRKVPGVTTILGKTMPKDALLKWAADQTANHAIDYWDELAALAPSARLKRLQGARFADRDQASNRGTEVHRLAAEYLEGKEIDIPEELESHVRSYESFVQEWDPQPVAVEFVVANPAVGYCGTGDLIADLADGYRWLLDIKTSRSGIFAETVLQLAAYRNATFWAPFDDLAGVGLIGELGIQKCGAIHVRPDGYSLIPITDTDVPFEYFRHLAWCSYRIEDLPEFIGAPARAPRKAGTPA